MVIGDEIDRDTTKARLKSILQHMHKHIPQQARQRVYKGFVLWRNKRRVCVVYKAEKNSSRCKKSI